MEIPPPSNLQPDVPVTSSVLTLVRGRSRQGKLLAHLGHARMLVLVLTQKKCRKVWWDKAESRLELPTLTVDHTLFSSKQLWILNLRVYPNWNFLFDEEKAYVLFISGTKVL